jgi:DNA polymerase-3 subunit delta
MPIISPESLPTELTKRKAPPGLLIIGKDAYLRDRFRNQVIETCIDPATREWAISRFSAEAGFENALVQARTVPMLAHRQLVMVSEVEELEHVPDERKDTETENLAAYLADPAPFTVLILEAGELDQRTKFTKMLMARALVLLAELPEDPRERSRLAIKIATQMARERNSAIASDAAEELADLCNCDLSAMQTEIEKLSTYAGADQSITRAYVELLVVSERKYSVWELAEVLATRQRVRAFQFLANVLEQGEPAPALIGAMAWMFRKLIEAQSLSPHTSGYQAAARLGMRASTAEIALQHARKIPRRQLVDALGMLYEADSRLKGGAIDDRAIMELVVAQITAPAAEAHTMNSPGAARR